MGLQEDEKVSETKEMNAQVSDDQEIEDNLSIDERIREIDQLIQAPDQIRKLELFLRKNIIKASRDSYEGLEKELLSQTIERLLDKNRRKWPRSVKAITVVAQTARSILWDIRNSKDALAENRRYEENSGDQDHDSWLEGKTASAETSKLYESCLNSKDSLEEINKLFDDDKEALDVLYAKHAYGYAPGEIQEMLGLTSTEYASKLTKINRRLAKFEKDGLGETHV